MIRTFITFAAPLSFSFGGSLIGGYIGGLHATRPHQDSAGRADEGTDAAAAQQLTDK